MTAAQDAAREVLDALGEHDSPDDEYEHDPAARACARFTLAVSEPDEALVETVAELMRRTVFPDSQRPFRQLGRRAQDARLDSARTVLAAVAQAAATTHETETSDGRA